MRLTEDAYDGWQGYADAHGVTVTALAEALGVQLRAGRVDMVKAVARARKIDAERRRRP